MFLLASPFVCPSVCMYTTNGVAKRIFMKFGIGGCWKLLSNFLTYSWIFFKMLIKITLYVNIYTRGQSITYQVAIAAQIFIYIWPNLWMKFQNKILYPAHFLEHYYYYYYYYYYCWYSALGLVWAGTRAQSGDRYGSGTLHPGKFLKGSLPLLSPLSNIHFWK